MIEPVPPLAYVDLAICLEMAAKAVEEAFVEEAFLHATVWGDFSAEAAEVLGFCLAFYY